MSDTKIRRTVAVIGHVDSGKSTLAGHLMLACGAVDAREMKHCEQTATENGKPSFKYAYLLDRLRSERERGISIEARSRPCVTPKSKLTLLDCPGHRDFVKNMLNASSQADTAVLVVAAAAGEFECGMCKQGQTREHALLAFTLGVKQLVIAVNKMDCPSVKYSQERFDEIKKTVLAYVAKVGFAEGQVQVVPVSAWAGDNLVDYAVSKMPWYKGPTVLQAIDGLEAPRRSHLADKPLRMPLREVFKIASIGTVVTGCVETGTVKEGETVNVAPTGLSATVKSIESGHTPVKVGQPGDIVGLHLQGPAPRELKRGNVCSETVRDPARDVSSFVAQLLVLDHPSAITCGYTPIMAAHTAYVPVAIAELQSKIDRRTGKELERNPASVKTGDACICRMMPAAPVCLEAYTEYPPLGRFALRDMSRTIGVGIIKAVTKKEPTMRVGGAPASVAAARGGKSL